MENTILYGIRSTLIHRPDIIIRQSGGSRGHRLPPEMTNGFLSQKKKLMQFLSCVPPRNNARLNEP